MKDFYTWNELKVQIDLKEEEERLFFKDAEVWWVSIGLNIGFEINGKNEKFVRPVVVVKKYNKFSFLALPLSTVKKENKYIVFIGNVSGKDAYANLSQLRNVDSKRLVSKLGFVDKKIFIELKKKASQVNFD